MLRNLRNPKSQKYPSTQNPFLTICTFSLPKGVKCHDRPTSRQLVCLWPHRLYRSEGWVRYGTVRSPARQQVQEARRMWQATAWEMQRRKQRHVASGIIRAGGYHVAEGTPRGGGNTQAMRGALLNTGPQNWDFFATRHREGCSHCPDSGSTPMGWRVEEY